MFRIEKSLRRERQRNKKRNGMQMDGRSVVLLQEILIKKGEKVKAKKKRQGESALELSF